MGKTTERVFVTDDEQTGLNKQKNWIWTTFPIYLFYICKSDG